MSKGFRNFFPQDVAVLTFNLYCLIIFLSGFLLGTIKLDSGNKDWAEQIKILFPVLISVFITGSLFIKKYIDSAVKREVDEIRVQLSKKFEPEERRVQQVLEYLCVLQNGTDLLSTNQINFSAIEPLVMKKYQKLSSQDFIDINKRFNAHHNVIQALCEPANDPLLRALAQRATKKVLGKKYTSESRDGEFSKFSQDIYAYLRVWLVCSVRYNSAMPVETIKQSYFNRKLYVEALMAIRDSFFQGEGAKKVFTDDLSRSVAQDYFQGLIDTLNASVEP